MRIVYSFPETIKETEQKIEKIKSLGFDAIQIPPIEPLKEEDKRFGGRHINQLVLT